MSRSMGEDPVLREGLKRLQNGAAHPDANVLSAFAERKLNTQDRAALMEHLAACPECREVIAHAAPQAPPKGKMRWLAPAAALAAAAMVVAVVTLPRAEVTSAPPWPAVSVHAPEIAPLPAPEPAPRRKPVRRLPAKTVTPPPLQIQAQIQAESAASARQTVSMEPDKPAPSLLRFAPNVSKIDARATAMATTPDWLVLKGQLFHLTEDGELKPIPVMVDGKPVTDPISSVDQQPTRVVVKTLRKQKFATPDLGEHWQKVDH